VDGGGVILIQADYVQVFFLQAATDRQLKSAITSSRWLKRTLLNRYFLLNCDMIYQHDVPHPSHKRYPLDDCGCISVNRSITR